MAEITAAAVKELREKTGLPMMDCKNALTESQGDMEKAISNLSTAVASEPGNPSFWYERALILLAMGRPEENRKDCAEMLQFFGQTAPPDIAHCVAWTCALASNAVGDLSQAVALAEKAAKSHP